MLIYFDESYDNNHEYLLLGALFNPHSKFLHRELSESKRNKGFVTKLGELKEIKYSKCSLHLPQQVAKAAIDSFIKSTSWFRCIVIHQGGRSFDLNYFGKLSEPEAIKKARAYKKFAELLIGYNTQDVHNAVLLTDRLKRCSGDLFLELIRQEFSVPYSGYSKRSSLPTLGIVDAVDTSLEQYQVGQVCDILLGCVLNNLCPTQNWMKNELREYLAKALSVPDFLPISWQKYTKYNIERYYPKFNVWYWRPKERPGRGNHISDRLRV